MQSSVSDICLQGKGWIPPMHPLHGCQRYFPKVRSWSLHCSAFNSSKPLLLASFLTSICKAWVLYNFPDARCITMPHVLSIPKQEHRWWVKRPPISSLLCSVWWSIYFSSRSLVLSLLCLTDHGTVLGTSLANKWLSALTGLHVQRAKGVGVTHASHTCTHSLLCGLQCFSASHG